MVWSLKPGSFPWLLLLHSLPAIPMRESQQPPLPGGFCTPCWVLQGLQLPHCGQGQPPYLLAPILYEVDGHCFIVDALQGQS